MAEPNGTAVWDAELRPRLMPYISYAAAVVIVVAHIVVGLLLNVKSSGVIFRTSDQVSFGALGVITAGAVLLFSRPRLRVGPEGVSVRNLLGDRLIPWGQVLGVSFPAGKRWARVDLPGDEYVPVMAIQAVDKDLAVAAMKTVRGLVKQYRPTPEGSPES